jgi:hypothetical protein
MLFVLLILAHKRRRIVHVAITEHPTLPCRMGCTPRETLWQLRTQDDHWRGRPLGEQVMTTVPYRSARRVLWIADNCSSHRGEKAVGRFRAQWPTLTLVHTPVHASWLNQAGIYFSIVQARS